MLLTGMVSFPDNYQSPVPIPKKGSPMTNAGATHQNPSWKPQMFGNHQLLPMLTLVVGPLETMDCRAILMR